MNLHSASRLAAAIALCELAGLLGSVFTFPAIGSWYASLSKPWFTPPSFVFGPVWITLYALMGAALYLVWSRGLQAKASKIAVSVFALQLALNALWSFLFFGLRNPFIAFIEIIALWIAIAATIALFWKISKKAALLLIPYLAWTTIAAALNYAIWVLN